LNFASTSSEARLQYDICGVSFFSAEAFPELTPSISPSSQVSLRLHRATRITAAGETLRPAATWTLPDGRVFLVSSKTKNGYLLHFDQLADFFIDQSGGEVVYAPRPGVPANSIRHLILDNVMALALSLRGHAVFHASAVVTPFGACAFTASSGTGKSTLAATFQQAGYQTLTDDCLLIEAEEDAVYGVPSYPGARFRDDSLTLLGAASKPTLSVAHYNSKRRYASGSFATERHPIAAVYCLERPCGEGKEVQEPLIETLSGHDGFLTAVRYLFCMDPRDPEMLVRQFKIVENLLAHVPIARLAIPDDFAALTRVQEAVLADLKARGDSRSPLPH
jgi:hypothetical protein